MGGAIAAVLVSAVAACADPSTPDSTPVAAVASPARTSYPLSFDNCGQKVTFTRPPERVLILNGTSVGEVESFVLLGLQDHILANAQSYGVSDDPTMVAAVSRIPKGGLAQNDNFDVPAEQVLAARPDLVVSTWSGGFEARNGFATRAQLANAGIHSLVNPVNCAMGKTDASKAEKDAYKKQSIESSFAFITLLGRIFDVQAKAATVVGELRGRVDAVRAGAHGEPEQKVLVAFPGMSMMNSNGLPAVMTGGIYDDVIRAAGGVNAFEGKSSETTATLNTEQLAAASVDLLVVGAFEPGEDPAAEARRLFAEYPQWAASKTRNYTTVSDGIYLGPLNAWAVEKIAKALDARG
ncbi:ABC transporter substrate-binding protein [Frankia sp. QA3]|uniref:ABC transporter substrate-binding protein n=1 Tax=Frankia sp. QA3 TaxID=710111 RepID=UPI000269C9B3|nr:ABC transporter substrate-binding protein [Frankia sp. QA3]EIV94676.1 ABC-type Fe3+-hydroxamate transport system, periplasmic component [Frankia sp. QA3]